MQKSFIALLGAFVMALTGCTEKSPADNLVGNPVKSLEGTSWQLVSSEPASAKEGENCENLPPVMDFLDKAAISLIPLIRLRARTSHLHRLLPPAECAHRIR